MGSVWALFICSFEIKEYHRNPLDIIMPFILFSFVKHWIYLCFLLFGINTLQNLRLLKTMFFPSFTFIIITNRLCLLFTGGCWHSGNENRGKPELCWNCKYDPGDCTFVPSRKKRCLWHVKQTHPKDKLGKLQCDLIQFEWPKWSPWYFTGW